jgi:dUTP pyrophosphatase|nr:MAG TPA: dUTPase [Crassvirales sp.]
MKLKIYYKSIDENIHPVVLKDGEWFDLMAAEDHTFSAPHNAYNTRITQYDSYKISLGIAMSLPVGIEAILAPRSSLFEKKGLELVNSIGVIDSTYSGNSDIWNAYLKASRDCVVTKGERIVQFRLQPSQKASVWTKLKWLFTSKIEFINVDDLGRPNRGGNGSTGGYKEV